MIFENNPHIFQLQCDIYQEIFDLAIENLNKIRRLKKTQKVKKRRKHLNEKLISKWEINIKIRS